MGFKIWHDDERPAPDDSWIRVHTNAEALEILRSLDIDEINCDYILADVMESGFTLTRSMIDEGLVPDKVVFHTSSYQGAHECISELEKAGYTKSIHEPLPIYLGKKT